ncbi:MAG: Holliday junction branch migration protein RuvA [Candidatus Gracilibacteria bacterium]|jgi:Holliday junction DNA helicase RuvA
MIRYLKGQVFDHDERTIILLVNGVGYHIWVPKSVLDEGKDEVELFIHSHIREDAFTLYGFRTKNELSFFELLLTINGIGPKSAMDICCEPVEKIQNAIFSGNLAALTGIPGIGKKIAERMVLELKGKITPTDLNAAVNSTPSTEVHPDVISALENLGYKRHHIQKVLSEIKEDLDTEALIRVFLQRA